MRSLCLFASYFETDNLPYYVSIYLKELKKQFTEVYLLTSVKKLNPTSLTFCEHEKIEVLYFENKGFDFGLWYQAFKQLEIKQCDRLTLVNDSCILFKPLDKFMQWLNTTKADIHGMTKSDAIYPHLQSYFLVLNKQAILRTADYFEQNGIVENIRDVIHTYEVGLNKYWQEKGLVISAYIDNNGYTGEFSPYYYCVNYHLENGIPLIKKKIIYSSYRKEELFTLARMNFRIDPQYYIDKILSSGEPLIVDLMAVKKEAGNDMSRFQCFTYNVKRTLIKWLRPVYKITKTKT